MARRRVIIRHLQNLALVAVLLAADLLTKHLVFARLDGHLVPGGTEPIEVTPFFRFVALRNEGITFGLGPGLGGVWTFLNVAAIAVLAWVLGRNPPGKRLLGACLALILAGAAGNLYDRLRFGWVRDFLDFHVGERHWPPFNVADASIVVGVAVLAFLLWRSPPEKERA